MRLCSTCKVSETVRPSYGKCRLCYNAYMRNYLAERYARRRQMAVDYLGGACAECGAVEDLEIDHIDRSKKSIDISKVILASDKKLFAELVKCQLLCEEHHDAKTSREMGVPHGGGVKGKRECPCELCREAARKYNREFSAAKRNKQRQARIAQLGRAPL